MDITERKLADGVLRRSIQEKEALLKEVHHRVKNNLQVISSLLRLETSRSGKATRTVLKDMQGRIRSMALLHETLYRTGRFARVDLAEYLGQLTNSLKHAFGQGGGDVRVVIESGADGWARLEVSDSGPGLPPDFEARRGASLGLQLVSDLARQLGGTLEIGSESVPRFAVKFPIRHPPTGPTSGLVAGCS